MSKALCVFVFASNNTPEEIVSSVRQSYDMIDDKASLWLWVRGKYNNGGLSGENWKTAFLLEEDNWQVRNEIVFACKVSDPAPENRLKRGYDKLLHLVRTPNYYYDRTMGSKINNDVLKNKSGLLVTRSGVVGKKYFAQIENSPFLNDDEKEKALSALKTVGEKIRNGEMSDFRLILRGVQKATKSVSEIVDRDGFFIRATKSHSVLTDDFWTRFTFDKNPFIPEGVLISVLKLSCPNDGVVFDVFPSIFVSKVVVETGRPYIVRGVTDYLTDYCVTRPESGIFELSTATEPELTCQF